MNRIKAKRKVRTLKREIKAGKKEIDYLEEKNIFFKFLKAFRLKKVKLLFIILNYILIISLASSYIYFWGLLICELPLMVDVISYFLSLNKSDPEDLKEELQMMIDDKNTLESMFLNKTPKRVITENMGLKTISCKSVLDSRATLGRRVVTEEEIDKRIDEILASDLSDMDEPQQEQIFGFEESGAPEITGGISRKRGRKRK